MHYKERADLDLLVQLVIMVHMDPLVQLVSMAEDGSLVSLMKDVRVTKDKQKDKESRCYTTAIV